MQFGNAIFTRNVAVTLSPMQDTGLTILPYLNDWISISPTAEQAVRNTDTFCGHVNQLGFTVNYTNSNLTPSHRVNYLGMNLNSQSMTAFLSLKKVEVILQLIGCFQRAKVLKYNLFLGLLGMLTAVSIVIPLGLLFLHTLQIWVSRLHLDLGGRGCI